MALTQENSEFSIAFKRMLKEQLFERGITNEKVISAIKKMPRELFVDEALKNQAYIDAPLQIGEGQTISQPYIVGLMTQALQLKGDEKVLEIGTGCGYQTSILSLLARKVYTIERYKSLAMNARQRLKKSGCVNVVMRIGDGSYGWPEAKPFDCIIVTCAAPQIPESYVAQLAVGGRMILPVAASQNEANQNLVKVVKTENGLVQETLAPCRFVPLVGQYGYPL